MYRNTTIKRFLFSINKNKNKKKQKPFITTNSMTNNVQSTTTPPTTDATPIMISSTVGNDASASTSTSSTTTKTTVLLHKINQNKIFICIVLLLIFLLTIPITVFTIKYFKRFPSRDDDISTKQQQQQYNDDKITSIPTTKPITLPPSFSYSPTKIAVSSSSVLPTTTIVPTVSTTYDSSNDTIAETRINVTTTFYVIGDVPYDSHQEIILKEWMTELLPISDAEFIIHVGDIRASRKNKKKQKELCTEDEYVTVANILQLSPVPMFVLLGDNDWNDCPNHEDGGKYWMKHLYQFENRYWPLLNTSYTIQRPPILQNNTEDFAFVHKGVLFIGLNLVGKAYRNNNEWYEQLSMKFEWTKSLILNYQSNVYDSNLNDDDIPIIGKQEQQPVQHRVVLFGHCNPRSDHDSFFTPLQDFIQNQLNNTIPILYVHGDKHEWIYETDYLQQSSFLRISVTGLGKEPPLKITITTTMTTDSTNNDAATTVQVPINISDVFQYDRQL